MERNEIKESRGKAGGGDGEAGAEVADGYLQEPIRHNALSSILQLQLTQRLPLRLWAGGLACT